MNNNGDRINLSGIEWSSVAVSANGTADQCESQCSGDTSCIGYMTEDNNKCDVILSNDTGAGNGGIVKVDGEKRVNCWKKA